MIKIKELDAEWTPDCQGKWDLDFDILRVSTRYYSPQHSYTRIYNGEFETGLVNPKVHSISGGIYLGDNEIWNYKIEDTADVDIKQIYEKVLEEKINKIYDLIIQAGIFIKEEK